MTTPKNLLDHYCPGSVEYARLADVATVQSGWGFPSKFQGGSRGLPFFKVADMNHHENKVRMSRSANHVEPHTLKLMKAGTAPAGTIIFPKIGAAVATNKKRILIEESGYDNNISGVIPGTDLNPSFLFYFFLDFDLTSIALQSGATPSIRKSAIEDIRIPLPSREVQDKIVEILDTFAALCENLDTEITQREQQFTACREEIFKTTHKYSETTLGAISKSVVTGATPKSGNPDYYENGTVPWLRTNEVNFRPIVKTKTMITEKAVKETSVKWVEPPSVVIAISGASAGRSGTIEVPVTTNQHCCNLGIDNDAANYRFVYHWVSSQYENLKIRGRGARGDLNVTIIKGFPIPLPPRDVQDEIVAQLDAMQELIDSLRLEREQRQKQFDYYREKLLSFPQKETAEV